MESLIKKYFSEKSEVAAAYLFGSQVENKYRPDSDVDIAILMKPKDSEKDEIFKERVIVELSKIIRKDIHPVIMNCAGEVLLRQIFSRGKCIHVNDSNQLAKFMIASLGRIAEFGYYRNIIQKGFVKNIMEGFNG
jgi:predicted nucleotidyltransferase